MYKSKNVSLTILTSIALAMSGLGCEEEESKEEVRHCVDKDNKVVPDEQCANTVHHGGGVMPFFWYYGGTRSALRPGTYVSGGSRSPTPGYTPINRSTVASRGGSLAPVGMSKGTSVSGAGFGKSSGISGLS